MAEWLDEPVTTVALCWRVMRRDGVALGFTAHDRDLEVAGFAYRAAPGIAPSAVVRSDGLEVDTLDISGALSDEAISANDLAAGRWDGARLTLMAVDWTDAEAEPLVLARGELGEVTTGEGGFTAELRGPTALLERPVVEATSPECRAELGDRRCRVNLAGRTRIVRVAAVIDAATIDVDVPEPVANAYGYGRLRWIEGGNSGLSSAIARSGGSRLFLREPPAVAPMAGQMIELVEGCDRIFATCCNRFLNSENFRGEPHLPGMDLLTRYPGA